MTVINPGLQAIAQVALTVASVERATEFYQHTLGLTLLFKAPPALAFFSAGSVRLMLSAPEGDFRAGGGSVIYFRVGDIELAHRELAGRGVAFSDEPHLVARMPDHELWMCFLKDPDGNTLGLMEERR